MAGKQAKILTSEQVTSLLSYAQSRRHPERAKVMILLSFRAGFRAGEVSRVTWEMVCGPDGSVGTLIELQDKAAKMKSGRSIPIHIELRAALVALQAISSRSGPVIRSERGGSMTPVSVVNWFASSFRAIGLEGCSSHSGRRTFITRAARQLPRTGGSLRDLQSLVGHKHLHTTERYVVVDTEAQRKLVSLI